MLDKVQNIVDNISELDDYISELNPRLEKVEGKILDLLHYVENNTLNIVWCYRYMKELKKLRMERRTLKNEIELANKYNENKTKLLSTKENRQLMLAEIHKRNKQLNMPYKNRQYTDEELGTILNGRIL